METMKLIAKAAVVFCVYAFVRISRAVESALWELCPEAVRQFRTLADGAHKALNAAQRGDEPAPVTPAFAAVLTPPAPTTGRYTSVKAWNEAIIAHNARCSALTAAKEKVAFQSSAWEELDREWLAEQARWRETQARQPEASAYGALTAAEFAEMRADFAARTS